ncbi:MAG: ATP-binding cassette domain-containing protein [Actinomycetota bacterium]|nr:ATP-binding cassette domain-containing protein [Actinomycetota bacterium]
MTGPVVELTGVVVTHPNGVRAVDGVDLTVGAGERVALVGPSGAGKSTLLDLLVGRTAIDGASVTGDVRVLGADARHLRGRARRAHARRIGSVCQSHDLVGPLRVVHNVNAGRLGHWSTWRSLRSLVRPVGRSEVAELLERVGLDPGLADARTDELSGGQRQRVALARVLRQRPELIVADEPVASLDPTLSELVLDLLATPFAPASGSRGATSHDTACEHAATAGACVVSLHQPHLARRFADRVVGLRDGRVRFDVTPGELTDAMLDALYERPDGTSEEREPIGS